MADRKEGLKVVVYYAPKPRKGKKEIRLLGLVNFALVAFVLIGFICLLNYYGYAVMPIWPDETLFLQPAQNLVEGKGLGTPALDDLLPGISQRTYWQPPVYFVALAAWGKLTSFGILSARWLSRFCAVGVLLLLWWTTQKWGISRWLALACVLWTALDLTFQYNSNLGRMDTMNVLWLTACLPAFTAYQQNGKAWQAAIAGLFGALATLTHFIAIPPVFTLALVLVWQRKWRDLAWFVFPVAVGWLMWLIYAAQDWQSFRLQLYYQFARKGEIGFRGTLPYFLSLQGLHSFFGVFVVNAPPIWFPLIVVSVLPWRPKVSPLSGWQLAFFLTVYCSAALGGEMWYIGWFTPFGYLLLSLWLQQAFRETRWHLVLAGLCLLWGGYQSVKVAQAIPSVPKLRQEIDRFHSELVNLLPQGSQVLVFSVPDPFPILQRLRPDLRLIQLSPTPMLQKALKGVLQQSDFFVGLTELGQGRGVPLGGKPIISERLFHAPLGAWMVRLYAMKESQHYE